MKTEDFERLKAVCDENGFEIFRNDGNVIVSKKKERVSGEYVRYHILWPNEDGATLGFSFKGFLNGEGLSPIKLEHAGKFLAEQLEKYLNNEL